MNTDNHTSIRNKPASLKPRLSTFACRSAREDQMEFSISRLNPTCSGLLLASGLDKGDVVGTEDIWSGCKRPRKKA